MKNTIEISENFSNTNIYTQWLRNNKNCFSETTSSSNETKINNNK